MPNGTLADHSRARIDSDQWELEDPGKVPCQHAILRCLGVGESRPFAKLAIGLYLEIRVSASQNQMDRARYAD